MSNALFNFNKDPEGGGGQGCEVCGRGGERQSVASQRYNRSPNGRNSQSSLDGAGQTRLD